MGCCESTPARYENLGPAATVECLFCETPVQAGTGAKLDPCGHSQFHEKCVTEWLTEHASTCPVCRKEVQRCNGQRVKHKKQRVDEHYADDMEEEGARRPEGVSSAEWKAAQEAESKHRAREEAVLRTHRELAEQEQAVQRASYVTLSDIRMDAPTREFLSLFADDLHPGQEAKDARRSLLLYGPSVDHGTTLQRAMASALQMYMLMEIENVASMASSNVLIGTLFWIPRLHTREFKTSVLGDALRSLTRTSSVAIATTERPWELDARALECFDEICYIGGKASRQQREQFAKFFDSRT